MNLTNEQVQAIKQGEPVRVVLPEVGEECVVLGARAYADVVHAMEGIDPKQAYPLIDETRRDGYSSPGMDDYDRYEEHRK
jgi:hypothetical protein